MREHDKYSWVWGFDPYFIFYVFMFYFFDDLALFILGCFHTVENMRGLNEYTHAEYHKPVLQARTPLMLVVRSQC